MRGGDVHLLQRGDGHLLTHRLRRPGGARSPAARPGLRAFLRVAPRVILSVVIGAGCSPDPQPESEEAMPPRTIEEVQEAHTGEWMRIPGVVGTGIGSCEGRPCIKVFASELNATIEERIPEEVEGYPVRVEVTGPFRARDPADPSG